MQGGVFGERVLPGLALGLCLGSVAYQVALYRFLEEKGGAHGTYGTGVGYKLAAARRLAGAEALYEQQRFLQMDQLGRVEPAQIDLPFLVALQPGGSAWPTNQIVLVYDANRANYRPEQVPQLAGAPQESFGPLRLYFLTK